MKWLITTETWMNSSRLPNDLVKDCESRHALAQDPYECQRICQVWRGQHTKSYGTQYLSSQAAALTSATLRSSVPMLQVW